MSATGAATRWPADRELVGRRGELGRLTVELELVRSERPRVVTVEGAAGMGKTALVRHFISGLPDMDVLDATGEEWESRLPYGVVSQLLAPVQTPNGLRGLATTGAPIADPLSVGAQLLAVMGGLAATRPLAIVIDDAHWADAASVQTLSFALRRLRFDAVLAVFVARDDGPGLPDAFRRLSSERGIHLAVGGLDAGELAELAALATGSKLSHRAATRLAELSGGNPLYAVDLLDEVGPDRLEALNSVLPAPRSFAKMVMSRLAGCSPSCRRLVEAASVLGPASPLGLAAKLGEVTNPLVALDEAVAARLLITGPGVPVQVEFSHPLTRAAVYHHLGAARRVDLHARAALLVAPGQTLGHRVAATVGDDAILAAELEARGRLEAGQGAWAVAARHLLDAARFCPARADHERMTLDAVDLLLGAGDVAEAARAACGIDQFAETARRDYLRGHLAQFMGRQAEAETLLSVAWDRCDPTIERALRSLISVDMAQLCGAQMRAEEAAQWARRAIETTDLAPVTTAALGVLVPCLGMAGRSADALALLPPFAAAGSDVPLDLEVLLARGTVRLWVDDLVGAREDLATVVGRGRGQPAARPALIALGALAQVEYRLGEWDDSVTHATQAVSLADDSDQRWMAAFLNSTATFVLAPRGDWDRAEAHAAAARDAARLLGDPMSVFCAAAGSAHVAFFKGEHRRVADTLQPFYDGDVDRMPEEPGVHPWRHLHAESLLRLGLLAEAREAVEALERLATSGRRRSSAALAARLRALLEAEGGRRERAREGFEVALTGVEDLGMPFDGAQTHEAYGRFLRRLGERRAAAAHLDAALTVYDRLGARHLAVGCATELAACGLAPRGRRQRSVDLSPQELAIARVVAGGATNREVAAELVVSVKTVEHHLTAVYAKLGVRSRTQLAARMAARHG